MNFRKNQHFGRKHHLMKNALTGGSIDFNEVVETQSETPNTTSILPPNIASKPAIVSSVITPVSSNNHTVVSSGFTNPSLSKPKFAIKTQNKKKSTKLDL